MGLFGPLWGYLDKSWVIIIVAIFVGIWTIVGGGYLEHFWGRGYLDHCSFLFGPLWGYMDRCGVIWIIMVIWTMYCGVVWTKVKLFGQKLGQLDKKWIVYTKVTLFGQNVGYLEKS